jgi:hypothetical protein
MNTFLNGFAVTFNPSAGWRRIAADPVSIVQLYVLHTIPFAAIPAFCWYIGVTSQGWSVAGDFVRLTPASALPMCVLFFLAMLAGVAALGFLVHWMAENYGSTSTLARGMTLVSYTASPFFLAGVLGLYPVLWLDILVGCVIACYCIYLLYRGTGIVMGVPAERSFLYASAVFAVALVAFVALLGGTVVLWEFGPAPEYTY